MGLFSKNKNKEKSGAPLPPPPAPEKPNTSAGENTSKTNDELSRQNLGTLTPPPVPGGSLDDIKNQVTAPAFSSSEQTKSEPSENRTQPKIEMKQDDDLKLSDSLFDLSDLSLPEDDSNEESSDKWTSSNFENHEGIYQHKDREDTKRLNAPPYTPEELDERSFVKRADHEHHISPNDDYFVTTSQFKAMLEIIESVKNKVKDSSERHLRLLDIKSEEDIEYENLRKDFQYIEDKLYEVDSIIFDN